MSEYGSSPQVPVPWWRGWPPVVLLPAIVVAAVPESWPRWALMWLLAIAIYAGVKWLTWRRTPRRDVPYVRHLGYLFAWPGLDAPRFLAHVAEVKRPSVGEWIFAVVKLAFGAAMFFGVARSLPAERPYFVGWAGMIGIVFLLHFGLFHLLSCGWRALGVDARPLMNWPVLAESLSDFWANRWNTAFRDLTHRFLFRPLTARFGTRRALFGGFLFSGLVHEAVTSYPARGGYGGPTLFFTLQAVGMMLERSATGRKLGLGRGVRGWAFIGALLLATSPLLLHPPFVTRIVVPFMAALRAI